VGLLPGVGPAQIRRLAGLGITRLGQLQALDERAAVRRLGAEGPSLVARARGIDARAVQLDRETKSVSAETTFEADLSTLAELERKLWQVCERLGTRLREQDLAAAGVTLKLKTARFALRTRAARLAMPTRLPDVLFEAGRALLAREADGTAFRLLGIGASAPGAEADRGDLADPDAARRVARQAALDALGARFGAGVVARGRGLALKERRRE
jgi:DNA polymerase-4